MSELLPMYVLIGAVFIPLMIVAWALVLRFGPRRGYLNQPSPGFQPLGSRGAQSMLLIALLHVIAGLAIAVAFAGSVAAIPAGLGVAAMGLMYVAFGAVNVLAERATRIRRHSA